MCNNLWVVANICLFIGEGTSVSFESQTRMIKFPINPRDESAGCYCSNEFDYQEDFTQFLEEARKSACKWGSNSAHLGASGKEQLDGERKNRKSWKDSLFSWLKSHRKSKSINHPMTGTTVSKPRCGHDSGPVQGTGGGVTSGRAQRAASGPLIGLFSSTGRVEEYEVPYMCLGQLNNTQKLHSYGPVYLVT